MAVARSVAAFCGVLFAILGMLMFSLVVYASVWRGELTTMAGLLAASFGLCCLAMVYRMVVLSIFLRARDRAERTPTE